MPEDITKKVLQRLHYGFYSVTSRSGEDVNAMVLNWLTQVSFNPRMIAIALQKSSYTHNIIETGKVFAINIFSKNDKEIIKPIAKSRKKNPNKMNELEYSLGQETGCPIIEGSSAFLECQVVEILDIGGDHDIVVGEVINAGQKKPGDVEDTLVLADIGWSYAG